MVHKSLKLLISVLALPPLPTTATSPIWTLPPIGLLASVVGAPGAYFCAAGLIGVTAALVVSQRQPAAYDFVRQKKTPGNLLDLFRTPSLPSTYFLLFIGNFCLTLLQPTLPLYLSTEFHFTPLQQGVAPSPVQSPLLVSSVKTICSPPQRWLGQQGSVVRPALHAGTGNIS